MTKRALEAAEGGEDDAALVRLVVVVKQVAGHAPTLPPRRPRRHQADTLIGHPDFAIGRALI